jgi:hypothetical protein
VTSHTFHRVVNLDFCSHSDRIVQLLRLIVEVESTSRDLKQRHATQHCVAGIGLELKDGLVVISASFTEKYRPLAVFALHDAPTIVSVITNEDIVVVNPNGFKMIRKTVD